MMALLLAAALFAFYCVIGLAFLSVFSSQFRPFQLALLSPAFGMAVMILPAFFLSWWGYPVQDFALAAALSLAALAAVVLAIKRPYLPPRPLAGFATILLVALLLIARPMLSYGFDWASYTNDDMANYCLSAARFLTNGYLTPPNLNDFFAGRDYAQGYWTFQFLGIRSGPDLMLSAVWAVTTLNAHLAFMPLICAFHLVLISAAAGIVAGVWKDSRAPLIAAALLAVSPLEALGVVEQLLAQIGGVALLCAAVAVLCRPPPSLSLRSWVSACIPAAVITSVLLIWYPESSPFAGATAGLYLLALTYRMPSAGWRLLAFYATVALVTLAVLNRYAASALIFVLDRQVGTGFGVGEQTYVLFPYFLVPSGISAFWGLTQFAVLPGNLVLSAGIVAGIALFGILIVLLRRQLKELSPSAVASALMLALAVFMVFKSSDYGLFKLSMFAQPFIAGVLAAGIAGAGGAAMLRNLVFAVPLLYVNFTVQSDYLAASYGATGGTVDELQYVSSSRIYRQFSRLFDEARQKFPSGVVSDTPNLVLAKFQALYSRGEPLSFVGSDFFDGLILSNDQLGSGKDVTKLEMVDRSYILPRNLVDVANRAAARKVSDSYRWRSLDGDSFLVPQDLAKKMREPWLVSNGAGTIFNRYDSTENASDGLRFHWADHLEDYLVFVNSTLGNYYYGGAANGADISFFQLEHDPMFPTRRFSSLGRRLLFMVREPTSHPRLVAELTTTIVKQFDSALPPAKANGVALPLVGRGSARVTVPVTPAEVDDLSYLLLDMGRDGKPFAIPPRGWLMSLYGRQVNLDWRLITAFASDISLISEDEYQALKVPASIQSFPSDLGDKGLEYSGIYEDGWISEHSYVVLAPQPADRFVRVKGMIPKLADGSFATRLQIMVDGTVVQTRDLGLGGYDIRIPTTPAPGRHKIELVWDNSQRLPGEDGRPTAGKVDFIGYAAD